MYSNRSGGVHCDGQGLPPLAAVSPRKEPSQMTQQLFGKKPASNGAVGTFMQKPTFTLNRL